MVVGWNAFEIRFKSWDCD